MEGRFPGTVDDKLDAKGFFEDYIQTYPERDLKQIINVTNLRAFRRFLSILAIRIGQLLNHSEMSKEIGVAVNTVKAWLSALEVSGLIILLPPYCNNLGKRIIDFVIEKKGEVFLLEEKHNERPNPAKLNFKKIAPLFKEKVNFVVACGVEEQGLIRLKDFSIYNPLLETML